MMGDTARWGSKTNQPILIMCMWHTFGKLLNKLGFLGVWFDYFYNSSGWELFKKCFLFVDVMKLLYTVGHKTWDDSVITT